MYNIIAIFIAFLGSQLLVTLADSLKHKERNEETANEARSVANRTAGVATASTWKLYLSRHVSHILLMSTAYGGMSTVAVAIAADGLMENTHGWIVALVSLVVVTLTCFGIAIASRDRIFPKSQQEVFQLLLAELESSTIRNPHSILRHAIFKGCGFVLIGGALTGLSMCVAHFGVAAFMTVLQGGNFEVQESVVIVATSFAIIGSIICFLLLFRVVSIFPHYEWLKVVTCAMFTLVTVGTYYLSHESLVIRGDVHYSSRADISLTIIQATCVVFSLAVNHWCAADMRKQIRSKMRQAATHLPRNQPPAEEQSVIAELSNSIRFRGNRARQVRVRPMSCISDVSTENRGRSQSLATTADMSNGDTRIEI